MKSMSRPSVMRCPRPFGSSQGTDGRLARAREFVVVFRLYRKHNTFREAVVNAWRIGVKRLPF